MAPWVSDARRRHPRTHHAEVFHLLMNADKPVAAGASLYGPSVSKLGPGLAAGCPLATLSCRDYGA